MKIQTIFGGLVLVASSMATAQGGYNKLEEQAMAQHCKPDSLIMYRSVKVGDHKDPPKGSRIVCVSKENKSVVHIRSNFLADRYTVETVPMLVKDFEEALAGTRA